MSAKGYIKKFPNKHYCIYDGHSFWEGDCWGYELKINAKLGTKREMQSILNNYLFIYKVRGAKVVDWRRFK